MNEYLSKSNDALCEMRLVVEGAIVLYEDEATPLYNMALKAEMPAAAAAFDIIGRALVSLRENIILMDEACRKEIEKQAVKSNN